MKRKFDLPMLLFTLVLSTLGMVVCLPLRDSLSDSVLGRVVWCALWFVLPLILGLIGVEASLALHSRHFRPARKRSLLAGFLAALLLGTVIGGGGGMLCMLERETVEEIRVPNDRHPAKSDPDDSSGDRSEPPDSSEPPEDPDSSEDIPPVDELEFKNVVLLIDASDSARKGSVEAPCQLIDSLDKGVSMQVAIFAYAPTAEDVRYKTDYLSLKDDVKKEFKEFIQTTDIVGGTSFDGPLQLALETLKGRSDAAIIMCTDGDAPLAPETYRAVMDSGVLLYLLRAYPAKTFDAQVLLGMANETGGGVLSIDGIGGESMKSQAKVQVSDVKAEKQSVSDQSEEHVKVTFGESLPTDGFGEEFSVWRAGVCIITYILYAVLITGVYYRRITLAGLLGSLCSACLTVCAITIDQRLCIPATAVLLLGAYTVYQVKENTTHV